MKEHGKCYFLDNCEHKQRINKGTEKKPIIRCLKCGKRFTDKMHLYTGMKKFQIRKMDNLEIGEE